MAILLNHQIPLFHLQGQMELKRIHVQGVLLCFMVENIAVIAVKNLNGKTFAKDIVMPLTSELKATVAKNATTTRTEAGNGGGKDDNI